MADDQVPERDPDLERLLAMGGFEQRADGSWRPGGYLRRLRWHVVLLSLVRDARRTLTWVRDVVRPAAEPLTMAALMPWDRAVQMLLPGVLDAVGPRRLTDERTVRGTAYGRPFLARFPAPTEQPADHVWAVLVWSGSSSGTGRPETMAACVTCSEARGQVVNPYACVIESVVPADRTWPEPMHFTIKPEVRDEFLRHYLNPWPQPGDEWPPVPESEYDGPDDEVEKP